MKHVLTKRNRLHGLVLLELAQTNGAINLVLSVVSMIRVDGQSKNDCGVESMISLNRPLRMRIIIIIIIISWPWVASVVSALSLGGLRKIV